MATTLSPHVKRESATQTENLTFLEAVAEPAMPTRRHQYHILTLEPSALLTREHARVFRAANYILRPVRSWHHAVEWVEQGTIDVVLLDADAIDASVSLLNVSTQRIIALLRRAAAGRPLTIAIVSARDFVEIEDMLGAGVNVFVPHTASTVCLVQRIDAARARMVYPAVVAPALSA